MLQFNTIVHTASKKFTSRLWWRLCIPLTTNAAAVPESINKPLPKNIKKTSSEKCIKFDELKTKLCSFLHMKSSVITQIEKAKNINDLMEMTKTSVFSKEDSATITEVINKWMKENDAVKKSSGNKKSSLSKQSEQTQFNVNNVDINIENTYEQLSTSRMIMEIYKMAKKNKRDVAVLRYLFENIIKYNDVLNSAQCSALMYSMSKLCYSDVRLLDKICDDFTQSQCDITSTNNSKLGSVLKSMASVRYKNNKFLEAICSHIANSKSLYCTDDIISILQSLALLGYESKLLNSIIEKYQPSIKINSIEIAKLLNYVWSLVLLNKANNMYVGTVLEDSFIARLKLEGQKYETHKLKVLNINAYAKYILSNYSGPFLRDTAEPATKKRTKQKLSYIDALEVTLKNIVPSPSHFRMNINTNMGFLLDAELYLDSNCRPICLNNIQDVHKKIAIMVFDYYDTCLGSVEPNGLNKFYTRLLKSNNYDVLSISYNHFGVEDKVEKHVKYLKYQLYNKYKNK